MDETAKGNEIMSFTTFIIPSIGRKTLANTLISICNQDMPNAWSAFVVFDEVKATITNTHDKIALIRAPKKLGEGHNSAGLVRNFGMQTWLDSFSLPNPEFFSFVDDDDTVDKDYVEKLVIENMRNPEADIIIFGMRYSDGRVLPPKGLELEKLENGVGISFSIKPQVFEKVKFTPSSGEDFQFLMNAKKAGFNIFISEFVKYNVSPLGIAEDRTLKK